MIRNAAVVALGEIDAIAYREQMMTGHRDKEWWVRYNCARELCAHVPLETLTEVLPTLNDRFATDILRYAIAEARMMGEGVALA